MSDLSPDNLRAAMALLRWTAADLAEHAETSEPTVNRFLAGREVRAETREKIASAVDRAGVDLFNGGRPGARRR